MFSPDSVFGGPRLGLPTTSQLTENGDNSGDDVLDIDANSTVETFDTGAGNDTVSLSGTSYFEGELGADKDTLHVYANGFVHADLGSGADKAHIHNNSGNATIDGGLGNDWFYANNYGNNILHGGEGYDRLDLSGMNPDAHSFGAYIRLNADGTGTFYKRNFNGYDQAETEFSGFERIYGSDKGDLFVINRYARIDGEGGNDTIQFAEGGFAMGGDGRDTIDGGNGDSWLEGGNGNDRIFAGNGDTEAFGDDGNDDLYGASGVDLLEGGDGNDRIYADDYRSVAKADASDDQFFGGRGEDLLSYTYSEKGAVIIDTTTGIASGAGAGKRNGQTFEDVFSSFEKFEGTKFADTFLASAENTKGWAFDGGDGDDVFFADLGWHDYRGGEGHDTVDFSALGDRGVTVDLASGVASIASFLSRKWYQDLDSIEEVVGSKGKDELKGSGRDEIFDGGEGGDIFYGRGGADHFVFNDASGYFGYDQIRDFGNGDDKIVLDDLNLVDGRSVNWFGKLDSNRDGVLTSDDADVYQDATQTFLLFKEGLIEIENRLDLTRDDFIFA